MLLCARCVNKNCCSEKHHTICFNLLFPAYLWRRRVLQGDHVGVGRSCIRSLFELFLQLARRRLPNTWWSGLQVSVDTSLLMHLIWVTPRHKMFIRIFCLCVFNSKILTLQELPSSDQNTVGERLSQKNGDIRHSTEKLPNGPDAASSKLTNTTNKYFTPVVPKHSSLFPFKKRKQFFLFFLFLILHINEHYL